jgi:polyhydroxyalkanoate synthesis repressor PhaR
LVVFFYAQMTQPTAVIRKYSDRRLYDTSGSRYVKLDDIARMIREGVEVEVRDARTGKDITRVILTQIIMEDAREGDAGPPLPLLRQMVMASDRATHDFLAWYLNSTLDLYKKAQQTLRSRVEEAKHVASSPLDFVRHLLAGQAWPPERGSDEVEEMRRRIRELEERVAELTAARRRPRPAK